MNGRYKFMVKGRLKIIILIFLIMFVSTGCKDNSKDKKTSFKELNTFFKRVDNENDHKNINRFKEKLITPSLKKPIYKKVYDLVKKVIVHIKRDGVKKIIKQINEEKKYWQGQFYVYIAKLHYKGKRVTKLIVMAHPVNKALRNKNLFHLKDVDGFSFIKIMVAMADKKGKGWIQYKWTHPKTKRLGKKDVYFEKIGKYIVACGIYLLDKKK